MEEVLAIAKRQIDLAIDQHSNDTEANIAAVSSRASAGNYLRGSRHLMELDKASGTAITERATLAWEVLHRCVTTAGVAYTTTLGSELKKLVAPYLSGTVGGLTTKAQKVAGNFNPGREADFLGAAAVAQTRAQLWIEAEIDLFCLTLSKIPARPHYSPHQIFNITGSTVGSLQTGAQSSATTTVMNLPNTFQDQVVSALETLRAAVASANLGPTAEGPLVLIDESAAEMAKPVADKNRVASLLTTIRSCLSGALETAPKIPQAIESVQRSLELWRTLS